MLNRPSATHPSQIFLHPYSNNSIQSLRWPIYIINWVDKTKLSRLEALVWALTFWHGLGWDFLRDATKPFGWFSDSYTSYKGKKEKTTSIAENFVRHFAIYVKQAHTSGYSHRNTFCGACANKMPLCWRNCLSNAAKMLMSWYILC